MATEALSPLPGTPEYQAFLQDIADFYADDPRIRAVTVFGSLGRGDWDAYSDADIDIVVADGVPVDGPWVAAEVRRLVEACGFVPAVLFSNHEEADLVLPSLVHASIRYHTLARTDPNLVESVRVLAGTLDRPAIQAAGRANRTPARDARRQRPLQKILSFCLLYAVLVDGRLHRRQFWLGQHTLHAAGLALVELFGTSRGGARWPHVFEAQADAALKRRFGTTLPGPDLPSLQHAFLALLDLLEADLETVSAGQLQLTDAQREMLGRLRARQRALDLRSA
jgi:hypothetical protein